ncbi:MAG TPA: TMEM175 family protein [Caulobacteraceae bacterium]|jgi:uncharacterized membrane protein|nr:TMEM175 family protein [Caulobacteraceae bacterium]
MTGEPESLDTTEPLAARRQRHDYDRLIMLADGVFAIAITLLAFDIKPPANWDGEFASLWATLKPSLLAYLLSFLVISVYWLAHRRFMAVILRVNAVATVLNLVVLGLVALLPAATRLAQEHGAHGAALGVYAGLVVAIGVSVALFWGYVALVGNLVSREVSLAVRWQTFVGVLFAPPLFLGLTIGAHLPPGAVPAVLLALFIIGAAVLNRLTRERPSSPGRDA